MIKQQADPLRFIKPRKKQFHLTPTKPLKCKASQQPKFIPEKEITKNPNLQAPLKSVLFQWQGVQKRQSQINVLVQTKKAKNNNLQQQIINNSNKLYDPLRYFSQDVEDFLTKKRGLAQNQPKYKANNKCIQTNNSTSMKTHQQNFYQSFSQDPPQYFIPLRTEQVKELQQSGSKQNTMRLEDYFQSSDKQTQKSPDIFDQRQYTSHQKINKIVQKSQISPQFLKKASNSPKPNKQMPQPMSFFKKTQRPQQKPKVTNLQLSKQLDHDYEENNNLPQEFALEQFQQCPICNRKFNPTSYQKHVKVCEKVFYKKRKEFSSQKQRSMSNKKKR